MSPSSTPSEAIQSRQHPSAIEANVIRVLHGCMTLLLAAASVYLMHS